MYFEKSPIFHYIAHSPYQILGTDFEVTHHWKQRKDKVSPRNSILFMKNMKALLGWRLSSRYATPPFNQCSLHIPPLCKSPRARVLHLILVTLSIAVIYLFYRFGWKVKLFLKIHNAETEEGAQTPYSSNHSVLAVLKWNGSRCFSASLCT